MKAYWDSSALIQANLDTDLLDRLAVERAFTRSHSLAEIFSTLTGKAAIRMDANAAAHTIKGMAQFLDFVDLTGPEIVEALAKAQSLGVRGGRVHDYIHALAAKKSGAKNLLTMDRNDFDRLVPGLTIEQL